MLKKMIGHTWRPRLIIEQIRTVHINVRLCLILELMWAMHLSVSVSVVFYQIIGLDKTDILLMQVYMWDTTALCDIPSGWLADRFGIRRILLIGIAMQIIQSALVPLWCRSFWQFSVVIVLTGIAWSFTSGTVNAIVTTTASKDFGAFQSLRVQATAVGALIGSIGGNLMADHISIWMPFIVQPLPFVLAFVAAKKIKDSRALKSRTTHPMITSVRFVCRKMLVERPAVRWAVLLSATINTFALASMWFAQPDMQQAKVAFGMFGAIYAIRTLGTIAFASVQEKIVTKIGETYAQLMLVMSTAFGALFAAAPTGWMGAVAILGANAVATAFASPLMFNAVQQRMSEEEITEHSTTIFSVATAIQALMMALIFPFLGPLSDKISTDAALFAIGVATVGLGGAFLYSYRRCLA